MRDSSFRTVTRQRTLAEPTDLAEPIYEAAVGLLRRELRGQRIRLVGVTASNFRDREQLALFGEDDPRRRQAAEARPVRRRFGERAVTRARLVRAGLPAPFERDPMKPVERPPGMHSREAVDVDANRDSLGDTDVGRGSRRGRLTSNTCSTSVPVRNEQTFASGVPHGC